MGRSPRRYSEICGAVGIPEALGPGLRRDDEQSKDEQSKKIRRPGAGRDPVPSIAPEGRHIQGSKLNIRRSTTLLSLMEP
jgi:hypothetical protein